MKFESITMENFMRYKGRNHIEFSCDDVKNVTVVLGDNTVGKTTIAQAFRWGLYGALMANGTKSAGDFQLLNTDILEMMDANSRAKVKVEIAAVDEEKRYIITRETTYTRAFPKLESREFQKKCAMRITELEDMESYVEVGNYSRGIGLRIRKRIIPYQEIIGNYSCQGWYGILESLSIPQNKKIPLLRII